MIQVVRNADFVPSGYVGPIQQIRKKSELKMIRFYDGVAALEIAWPVVRQIKFRGDLRPRSKRLAAVAGSIRERGYVPFDPIICRVTKKRKFHVIDGGHRLTAARMVDREFWTNLFNRKIKTIYFLVFESSERWPKVKRIADEQGRSTDGDSPKPGARPWKGTKSG